MSKPTPYMPKGQRKARKAAMRRREGDWMNKLEAYSNRRRLFR